MSLNPVQTAFLDRLMAREALRFGEFTLKSGRKSPYFVNTGCFCMASDLVALGDAYAGIIKAQWGLAPHVIFGPAYKGIPLALAASEGLLRLGQDCAWSYDRKEVKDHGDGGRFVGAPLKPGTKVVVVDDVLTAGTALRQSLDLLRPLGVEILGAVVSVDRQERGKQRSAREEISADYGIPVATIIDIRSAADHLLLAGQLSADLHRTIVSHLDQGG